MFELTVPRHGVQGLGQRTANGFLVLAGSQLREDLLPSAQRGVHATRDRYADQIQNGALISDLEFTSPSAAAAFLVGGAANGRRLWHLQDEPSTTLADWEDREGDEADHQAPQIDAEKRTDGG